MSAHEQGMEALLVIMMHINQPSEGSYMLSIINTNRAIFLCKFKWFSFGEKRNLQVKLWPFFVFSL